MKWRRTAMALVACLGVGAPVSPSAAIEERGPEAAATASPWAGDPEPVAFPQLPGAASGHHLWFATPDPERPRRSRIHHVATDREPPTVRIAAVLEGQVEAMAAWGEQAWIVLAPRAGSRPRREVVTLETARNPASGLDYSWPREGPTLLPSMPGDAKLVDFAADAAGPVALVWPPEWRSPRVRRASPEGEASAPRLLRLRRGGTWEPIELAAGMLAFERLATVGQPARSLLALAADPADAVATIAIPVPAPSLATSAAESLRWPVPASAIIATASLETGELLVLRRAFGSIDLAYPRAQGLLELGGLEAPTAPWRIDATLDGIRFIEEAAGGFEMRAIDPIDGTAGPAVALGPPQFGSGAWLHLPILAALAISAVLALVLFRPLAEREPPAVPEGFEPLPLPRRLAALAIDLAPCVGISMLVFGVSLREFSLLPAWSLEAEATAPSALVIALMFLWGVGWESIAGRTPGKMLLGGRIEAVDGVRVPFGRVLIRNLFKAVLLAAPILAIFTVLNPLGQGIGEVLSRTLVLGRRAKAEPESRPDSGEDDRG